MMFGSVSEHFTNLRHVKRCRTCDLGLNGLFRGTDVANHPFNSIRTKMMLGSVLEHFANLMYEKICKICVLGPNALFRGTEAAKHPFYSIGTKMMFGVFQSISLTLGTFKDGKIVLRV
jgi:hypothetical protein